MFFKKNRRDPANPAWLKIIVVLFIAYAFFSQYNKNKALEEGAAVEELQATKRPGNSITIAGSTVKYPSRSLKRAVVIGGDIEGSGSEASCGELASVRVNVLLPQGISSISEQDREEIFDKLNVRNNEVEQISVGDVSENREWAIGVIGMKVGGIREVIVPANKVLPEDIIKRLTISSDDVIRYKVSLEKLEPSIEVGRLPFRAMDIVRKDRGEVALCGRQVFIHMDIWSPEGEKIFSTKSRGKDGVMKMTLGRSEYFYGLDKGILGMRKGGFRSLIVPSEYFVSGSRDSIAEMEEATQQQYFSDIRDRIGKYPMVIADVSLVAVGDVSNRQ